MRSSSALVFVFCLTVCSSSVLASIDVSSISGGYSQDFNTLASTGISVDWTNDTDPTLPGWSLYRVTSNTDPTPFPIVRYEVSDGGANSGRFYSFGAESDSDRAFGGIGSGFFGDGPGTSQIGVNNNSLAGWIAVSFTNDTLTALSQFNVEYDGEQWRDGGDNEPPVAQTMVFQYGFGSTFGTVTSWTTPGGSFNFTSPVFTTTQGAIDGNNVGRVADLGGTISDLNWNPGETLWLRWVEHNDNAVDHGLAIDNFSFSTSTAAVPEPGAALFCGVTLGTVSVVFVVRRALSRVRNGPRCY